MGIEIKKESNKVMKKQDLKDGMILEVRNGDRYLLTNGVMRSIDGFMELEDYSEDLRVMGMKILDIVKVYEDTGMLSLQNIFKDKHLTLIWERKEIKLTDREIELLKAFKILGHYLARDKNGDLYVFFSKPTKESVYEVWGYDDDYEEYYYFSVKEKELFNFITWEDEEPTNIDDLLNNII